MKKSLKANADFKSKVVPHLQHTLGHGDDIVELFNLEISEGVPGDASYTQAHLGTSLDADFREMVYAAIPAFAETQGQDRSWIFHGCKAKNPEALKAAWEAF